MGVKVRLETLYYSVLPGEYRPLALQIDARGLAFCDTRLADTLACGRESGRALEVTGWQGDPQLVDEDGD